MVRPMRTRTKLGLGLLAGAGALWGTRAWLQASRWFDLQGRVVIVTGSTSGLGLMLARQAVQHGARVVLNGRHKGELDAAEADLRTSGGAGADVFAVAADVSDEDQARHLVERTLQHYGALDVLVNNAGVMLVGPQATMTADDYRALMAVNYYGALYPTLAALPHLRTTGFGRIANIVSIGGLSAVPHLGAYCASKFALTGLTRSLRAELARDGILVTGVYPKTIRTGGHTHAWFKGNPGAEYRWFAASDTLPLLSASAETTAHRIWTAIQHGDPDLFVGLSARLAIAFDNLVPGWSAELKALVEQAMPAGDDPTIPAVRGEQIQEPTAQMFHRMVPSSGRPRT